MILGYPGSTTRYITSYGIEEALNITHPNRIKIRGKKLELMNEDMNSDPGIRIKYAAKYKGASNYWKYSIGQTEGLNRLMILDKKKQIEEQFRIWVKSKPAREAKYGEALDLIEKSYKARHEYANASQYLRECLISGSELFSFVKSTELHLLQLERPDIDDKEQIRIMEELRTSANRFFKDYNPSIDKKIN